MIDERRSAAPLWADQVAPGVAALRVALANVFLIGPAGSPEGWVLVDAGVGRCAPLIAHAAEGRFGRGARPTAIVLTHGHFDHVGAVRELAERWDVPVYAHRRELPYLTGRADYPPPDPAVGGGAMASLSFLYPRRGIDLGEWARPLPTDGSLPELPGWRVIHTPGHTPGHISLFREADRLLIAGDAVVTTRQESAAAAATWAPEVRRPPAYFTIDWREARRSVERLAALRPRVLATGHGRAMEGEAMLAQLEVLAREFDHAAVPDRGHYVRHPAEVDDEGLVHNAPAALMPPMRVMAGVALASAAAAFWLSRRR